MKKTDISIINKSVNDLMPYSNNARIHSDEQINQIAASIKEFGFNNPVLVDKGSGIIAGHGRVIAAKKLGIDKVPTIELSHLTEEQKKAFIIADNKIALNSEWDELILHDEIKKIIDEGINVDLVGFNDQELEDILDNKEAIIEKKELLSTISMTRILLSIPTGSTIEGIDEFLEKIKNSGGEVDISGN